MSEVKLLIGGREYMVACAEGEEAHVARLGETVDAKLQQLGSNLTARDAQNLLFAALLLADELHEQRGGASVDREEEVKRLRAALQDAEVDAAAARAEIETARRELDELRAKPGAGSPAPDLFRDPGLAPALERFADLLENCAEKLESKAAAH
ncbi:cell division protein ZapA [Pelagerythrobacter rhizovicinus]|uniref:Cell division protein ZapA n=1 Tax=Pelagerythrobacter rhizovicinus TaxID=2268576 RepID=A0A4Q2KRJ3_9SPHN|nr:cell division protein ZapA [Pelagerythrobacter rhizovicinus]RXZ66282.1 cell division protein ZapA [Pelagerythrobacter rhizovicinus]